MNRRELIQSALATLPLISVARAQEIAKSTNGLPSLTIKDVKVITTNGGSHYRWIFIKIITSEGAQIEASLQVTRCVVNGFNSTRIWIVQVQATVTAKRSRTNCIV